jgi:hypothetical protein
VLKEEEVGADEASSGNSEKLISPRMMNGREGEGRTGIVCLRTKRFNR